MGSDVVLGKTNSVASETGKPASPITICVSRVSGGMEKINQPTYIGQDSRSEVAETQLKLA